MTGFGAASIETDECAFFVEIKTLNSKFLDVNLRLSHVFSDKEIEIKNWLSEKIERGKVNLNIKYAPKAASANNITVNAPAIEKLFNELSRVATSIGADKKDLFNIAMQAPDAYIHETNDVLKEAHWALLEKAILQAIEECNAFRLREGKVLAEKIISYSKRIADLLLEVIERDPLRIQIVRDRLHKHLSDFVGSENFDKNRFEQEIVFYIEKFDITEEKVRLRNHLDYFEEVIAEKNSNGKKLNFIVQELGREINTIGSKANDSGMQRLVVEMKDELEKIKEQLQNII